MADWSQLPKDLLQLISQRLNSEVYLIRFRSVCSSWRQSSVPNCHHNHLPSKLPHFPTDEINNVCDLSKQSIFLIKPPTNLHQQETPLRPWLIRIDTYINGKPYLWHPFDLHQKYPLQFAHDLIDFNQLSILHLRNLFYIHHIKPRKCFGFYEKAVVATCEVGQPLAVLTYDYFDVPKFLGCEDNSWTSIPTMSRFLSGDMCLFKGRPCVADINGQTLMIGPEDSSVRLLANPVFGGNIKFLVESECESLLLVDCNEIGNRVADKDVRFDVFRLDEKEKKWIKLTTLGDMVLFLGADCSFSASALDLRVPRGNCLIYRRNFDSQEPDVIQAEMRIFYLDQGRVSFLSDYPDYMKLFWPPPKWIPKRYDKGKEEEDVRHNETGSSPVKWRVKCNPNLRKRSKFI
ncbi:F-box protein SKIP23 [Trifolium repens]|nr:F-box protein SKIP23 [Trifolium repens]